MAYHIASVELTREMSTLLAFGEPGRLRVTWSTDCLKVVERALAALRLPPQQTSSQNEIITEQRKFEDREVPPSPVEPSAGSVESCKARLEGELRSLARTIAETQRGDATTTNTTTKEFRGEGWPAVNSQLNTISATWTGSFSPHRPANINRTIFHVLSGIGVIVLFLTISHALQVIISVGACAAAWGVEFLRRRDSAGTINAYFTFAAGILHPHEWAHVTSSTYFATAVAVLAVALPYMNDQLIPAMLTLALSDPAAGLIGRRYGTYVIIGRKTAQGCAAFWIVGFVSCFVGLLAHATTMEPSLFIVYSMVGATAGMVAEIVPFFDDNFNIPVAVAVAIKGAWYLLE